MGTNYPTSIDSFTVPTSTEPQNSPSHSGTHANEIAAIEAIESFIGTSGQPSGGLFNIRNFGAKIDGSTDDTAAWTAAIAAAAVAGGEVFHPGGTSITTAGVTSSNANVQFRGVGRASILKAGSTNVPLAITGQAFVSNMVFDGGGTAANAALQTVVTESSYPSLWSNVVWQNATSYQYSNVKCEDVMLHQCHTPGANGGVQINVPSGAGSIIGGQLFGICDLTYQTYVIVGAVTGPLNIDNPSALNGTLLSLDGCYIYDGQSWSSTHNCITTANNLTNIIAKGCQFVSVNAASQRAWINGNIPAGVTITLDSCLFTWVAGTAGTCQAVQASGAGAVFVNYPSTNIGSATFANFNGVSTPTTVVGGVSQSGVSLAPATSTSGGASYSTPTLANTVVGSVVNATEDVMLYLEVTTVFVALVISMGPAATPTNAIFTSAACPVGTLISLRVPAGWFVATSYTSGAFHQAAVTC